MITRIQDSIPDRDISFWGAGFVAMDVVEFDNGSFATTGGSCGNVVAILAWLGWHARPIARLGKDEIGNFVRTELNTLGADVTYLSSEERVKTPVVMHKFSRTTNGNRSHHFSFNCPACGKWLPRHRSITLKQATALIGENETPEVFYFDRVSPGSLFLAQVARDRGALVIFEPASGRDNANFRKAIEVCHVFKYSYESLHWTSGRNLLNSPELVVETRGASGLRFRWNGRWSSLDAYEVRGLVDAAGSGDWCTALLIHQLATEGVTSFNRVSHRKVKDALATGQAAAAINCRLTGSRGIMFTYDLDALNKELLRVKELGCSEQTTVCDRKTYELSLKLSYCIDCKASAHTYTHC